MGRREGGLHGNATAPGLEGREMERGQEATKGGIVLLLDHIGAKHLGHEQVTVALWRHCSR